VSSRTGLPRMKLLPGDCAPRRQIIDLYGERLQLHRNEDS
jgi:hypothetical protein